MQACPWLMQTWYRIEAFEAFEIFSVSINSVVLVYQFKVKVDTLMTKLLLTPFLQLAISPSSDGMIGVKSLFSQTSGVFAHV